VSFIFFLPLLHCFEKENRIEERVLLADCDSRLQQILNHASRLFCSEDGAYVELAHHPTD
jgi:hypothetical protein